MLKNFFQVYGDQMQSSRVTTVDKLRQAIRTRTAREVEQHAGVNYEELVSSLPPGNIDGQLLMSSLSANAGRGTPLAVRQPDLLEDEGEDGWNFFNFDLMSVFQKCGSGKRETSPESVSIP